MRDARGGLAASAVGAAAAGVAVVVLYRKRRAAAPPPPADADVGAADADARASDAGDEDPCAICLEPPAAGCGCRTQCGHLFCGECFLEWWRRQPGLSGGPTSGLARCPLCSGAVTSLKAEGGWVAGAGGPGSRAALLYNASAGVTQPLRRLAYVLAVARSFASTMLLGLYVFGGNAWEAAHESMRHSAFPVPLPRDLKLRHCSRWLVAAHLMRGLRIVQPADGPAFDFLIRRVRPVLVAGITLCRDARHALIVLDAPSAGAMIAALSWVNVAASVCKLARVGASAMHALRPELGARLAPPVVLCVLDVATLLADLALVALSWRIEAAGVRGLLMLLSWRSRRWPVEARRVTPYAEGAPAITGAAAAAAEAVVAAAVGLAGGGRAPRGGGGGGGGGVVRQGLERWCRIEEYDAEARRFYTRSVTWREALWEYGLALRALRAFHGRRGMGAVFAPWAVDDICNLPPLPVRTPLLATADELAVRSWLE